PRNLCVSDFGKLPEGQRDAVLNLMLRAKDPAFNAVWFDEYTAKSLDSWIYLCEKLPDEYLTAPHYKSVRLISSMELRVLLERSIKTSSGRELAVNSGLVITEELCIANNTFTKNELERLLQLTPQVK